MRKDIMEWSSDLESEDMEQDDEIRTANIIALIANQIEPGLSVTIDCPSLNEDRRMLVLDLKIWVDNEGEVPRITYSFYKKKVSSKYTMLKRSAVSEGTKKATIFQEGLRRLSHIESII